MQQKPWLAALSAFLLATTLSVAQQHQKPAGKPAGPAPDKALLQKIWDGWSTLEVSKVAEYYATGPHVFFDLAPLKYASWDEYAKGVTQILSGYKSAKLTVNDDAEFHPAGEYVWGTATVKEDAILNSGKREMATIRWTYVFGKQDGKWVLVHEHVSEPLQ
ncbi:MAG TPA: nuclear transport factor 2 family protein [Terriglobales bacterium]|nr:nuclear transport factor 2 family protein [Terriglobales bacterium]